MARMTSYLLVIIGTSMISSTLVLCDSEEEIPVETMEFVQCKRKSQEQGEGLVRCLENAYVPEEMDETSRMYNKTKCVKCMHFCRKRDVLVDCMRETADHMKNISEKARHMVPFILHLAEGAVSSVCDNGSAIMSVLVDEEITNCMSEHWRECRPRLQNVEDLDRVAICNYSGAEEDPFTKQFVCQSLMDFLECAQAGAKSCPTPIQNALTSVISKLRSWDSCSKYF